MEEARQVGIWIRVSTEDQAKGESPEHHEKRARSYAESKGWEVKEVYHLEAVSGKSVMNLPVSLGCRQCEHRDRTGQRLTIWLGTAILGMSIGPGAESS